MPRQRRDKGITAWLVTWDWQGEHARPARKIEAVLNRRWSPDRVAAYLEFIYLQASAALSEKISLANEPKLVPYRAQFGAVNGVTYPGEIVCGDNPWLRARLVDGLQATGEPDDEKGVVWVERPKPPLPPGLTGSCHHLDSED